MAVISDSRALEPDLILSSDKKEVLFVSDLERERRVKSSFDFFTSLVSEFLGGLR